LIVDLVDSNNESQQFSLVTDKSGYAEFNIDFPIGKYDVHVTYLGNGYFDGCNNSAVIEVLESKTSLTGFNATYYGKNNRYIVTLNAEASKRLSSLPIVFTISNSQGVITQVTSLTDYFGQAEIIFSLDVGRYNIKSEFMGDSWYGYSSIERSIEVRPANSTLIVPNSTLYGQGCIYNVTLKDTYGNLIRGENVIVTLTQGSISDRFTIKTDDWGRAGLAINYLPGAYNVNAEYLGDDVYGPAKGSGVIHVEKVLTIVSGFHYSTIPLKGVYTVVLSDMYGRRVFNETITLNCYQSSLVKSYQLNTDSNGEASFIIDLAEGTYLATFDYDGNIWYADATSAATIVIDDEAELQKIQITSTDLVQYYGENKYFIIEFNDPNAYSQYGKKIQVSLSSGEWSQAYEVVTDAFGLARLQIKLNPGEYNITYKYSNSYYNIFGSGSNRISVYKMPATLLGKDLILNLGESRYYEISLRDINNLAIKNMQVYIDLNGSKYNVTTNDNGIAKLLLNLFLGKYNITYGMDNPNYISEVKSSTVLVVDSDKTPSTLLSSDVNGLDNETVKLNVNLNDLLNNGIGSCEVTLQVSTFDGESIKNVTKLTDRKGSVIFELDLEYGKYIAEVIFNGNGVYLGSSSVSTINIESSDDKIRTVQYNGETRLKYSRYYVVLSDVNGTLLTNKTVTFYFGDEQYFAKTNSEGKAILDLELYPDVYTVKSVFEGDNKYKKSSISTKLYISGNSTQMFALPLVKYYRNGTQFHAKLVDGDGNSMANKTISVLLNNVTYNCTTDDDGWITLRVDLKPGTYDVECSYYGRIPYENSFNQTTITVLSTIEGKGNVRYYGDTPYMTVKFFEGSGSLIKNSQFVIGIDGTNYLANTGSSGIFNFNLNLASGGHVITVTNPYDGLSESYAIEILPTVFANKIIKVLCDGKNYTASFLDKKGNPLRDTSIDVIIDGIQYNYQTDEGGVIRVSMEMAPKSYLVTVINPDTGEYIENTMDVYAPITQNKDVTMYFDSGDSYDVKIIGSDGKPVGGGVIVKFTIAGKKYDIVTDENGCISLKITFKPGVYGVTVEYSNYRVSNKITVKPVLTASDVTVNMGEAIKFKAKLVDGKGKPLKGKMVTFVIDGKKYGAKTNKNGIATIKVKLTLKVGRYAIQTSYGKSVIMNAIIVKKALKPVLTAKDVSVNKGNPIRFSAKLVDGKGNPLKGKKITFKIKGKKYVAKTNKKGIATINIKLKLKIGRHAIQTSYGKSVIKNTIKIKKSLKPVLTAKNVVAKKGKAIKFKARLADGKGKALKGKKITFKIKGKKYVAKTNKKGIATIKIKLKLKVGKHIIRTTYGKSAIKNKITVKK
jgi:hypothetical protein